MLIETMPEVRWHTTAKVIYIVSFVIVYRRPYPHHLRRRSCFIKLNLETVIQVDGMIIERSKDTINPEILTGEIDLIRNVTAIGGVYAKLNGAKEAGKLRVEGADYLIKDGDVLHFRFNV